jgi:hypothetical protein
MRYRLRTLLILLAIAPPLLAVAWMIISALMVERELDQAIRKAQIIVTPICARVSAGLPPFPPPLPPVEDDPE